MLEQGSPVDLGRRGIDFLKLVETVETQDTEEKFGHFKRSMSQMSRLSQTSRKISTSIDSLECQDEPDLNDLDEGVPVEASSKGTVKGSLYMNYFQAGTNWFVIFILGFSFVLVQFLTSASDYWISVWYEFYFSII